METLTEKLRHDPHIGKPIPGQSLTATPGSMPYENPPQVSSAETAYGILKAGLYQPKTQRELGEVTRAGISCETLASSMVMMAFSQGMFNPDVAEIIKGPLAFYMLGLADEYNIPVKLFGDEEKQRQKRREMPHNQLLNMMKRRNPDLYT